MPNILSAESAAYLEQSFKELLETKGTLEYSAPEIFAEGKKGFTKAADIYSYGIILWELAACQIPYLQERRLGKRTQADIARFTDFVLGKGHKEPGRPTPEPESLLPKNPSLARLIKSCWSGQLDARPKSAEEIIGHLQEDEALEWQAEASVTPSQLNSISQPPT